MRVVFMTLFILLIQLNLAKDINKQTEDEENSNAGDCTRGGNTFIVN